jgi:cytochrome c peroxidase
MQSTRSWDLFARTTRAAIAALSAALIAACDAPPDLPTDTRPNASVSGNQNPVVLAQLGGRIFRDKSLSLLRNQSCESCHDPAWGFTSPNAAINAAGAVMPGSLGAFGTRKPPSAAYATPAPVMFFDDVDGTFVGGNFWDGHATGARLGSPSAEQALFPFPSPKEQALPDIACVVQRVRNATYSGLYEAAWGRSIFSIKFPDNAPKLCDALGNTIPLSPTDRQQVLVEYDRIGLSIAAFEDSPEVNQFSSKYDAYLDGKATLTATELKGLALYEGKAGCAACHPNAGKRALFTDYTYDNIGVPANPLNPAKLANPAFRDLGVGGFVGDPSFNGGQKVATLRNLDKRGTPNGAKSYMHNGVLKSLQQVVHFYNTRDVLPNCANVATPVFAVNCWPAPEVTENVNVDELGNLGLTADEEAAVVAYLKTLTDGYKKNDK